ncbi:hypothetical protein F0562_006975 [Nyssa sinensis]|uniref:CCHC-type domain-containing protein n=1 Tax=Nyssa sinensis TaxID=561372 RepID=A0A5J5A6V2_9ASTE|nr:hypothetical protein F0562_006975 [Nyssa sinensis]
MASSPVPSVAPVTPPSIHSLVTIKLSSENYLLWKAQIMPYLRGQRLFGYVDGSCLQPSQHIPNPEADKSPTAPRLLLNPEFSHWFDQDQIVLSILMSSLSESILAKVIGVTTSREVCHRTSLPDTEIVSYLLGGLDSSYDPIVTSIQTREDPMELEDIFGHLLTFELRLQQHTQVLEVTIGSANVATRTDYSRGPHGKTQYSNRASSYSGSRGRGRGRGGHHGSPGGNRPMCQICGKAGHLAIKCFHRFDQAYQTMPNTMSAFFTAQQAPADTNWYPNTGSTNHLTNDLQNLNLHAETYAGSDQIQVGDGAGLAIAHIGSSEIKSSQSVFNLRNILHVPQIKKNLISVSQFTKDNNVFVEFHSSHFFVKDEVTKKVLLQGTPKDGLYPFPSSISTSSPSQSFFSQRVSLEVWHHRFGHSTYQTVKHLVSKFSFPVSSNKIPSVCSACQQGKSHRLPFSVS